MSECFKNLRKYPRLISSSVHLSEAVRAIQWFIFNKLLWAKHSLFLFIFVLFSAHWKYSIKFDSKWKMCIWSAWDLNPGPQVGKHRKIHLAMAATKASKMVCQKFNFITLPRLTSSRSQQKKFNSFGSRTWTWHPEIPETIPAGPGSSVWLQTTLCYLDPRILSIGTGRTSFILQTMVRTAAQTRRLPSTMSARIRCTCSTSSLTSWKSLEKINF